MNKPSYDEGDLLPISGLQHLLYCPRQCALIHIEQVWEENRWTAEGRLQHERVDRGDSETRRGVRVEYGLPIRSLRLGLVGKADVVEFHRGEDGASVPIPVEHKRGRPKAHDADKVQLCAQAMCLEEMLGVAVKKGFLFYGRTWRRCEVLFDAALREETRATAEGLHRLLNGGATPRAVYDEKKCGQCSLFDFCKPKVTGISSAVRFLAEGVRQP